MILETDAVLEKAAVLKTAGTSFALVTVVRCESPTSAKPGAKAIVEKDGIIQGWVGGGCVQAAVIKMSLKAIEDGQSRLLRVSPAHKKMVVEGIIEFALNCHSGGTLDIFIDPVIQRPALLIIGASPIAQTLCSLAQKVGFSVTVASPGADKEMFADASHFIGSLKLSGLSPQVVVVSTQGKNDESGLEAALSTNANYIAFVASERKASILRQYLKQHGHEPNRVDAIVSPAGIEIGAVTADEIALSILASLVKERRIGHLAQSANAAIAHSPSSCCGGGVKQTVEGTTDPVCGMSVEQEVTEWQVEHDRTRYYFCGIDCKHQFVQNPEKYLG